jgi:hypothetical protein
VSVSDLARARFLGGVSTRIQPGADATLEQRVGALEHNLQQLDAQAARQTDEQNERHAKLAGRVSKMDRELREQQGERERERREQLRESIAWQWMGTGLFLIGAILAGVANGAC